MRFEEELFHKAVPEWREMYLDYSSLQRLVDELCESQPQSLSKAVLFNTLSLSRSALSLQSQARRAQALAVAQSAQPHAHAHGASHRREANTSKRNASRSLQQFYHPHARSPAAIAISKKPQTSKKNTAKKQLPSSSTTNAPAKESDSNDATDDNEDDDNVEMHHPSSSSPTPSSQHAADDAMFQSTEPSSSLASAKKQSSKLHPATSTDNHPSRLRMSLQLSDFEYNELEKLHSELFMEEENSPTAATYSTAPKLRHKHQHHQKKGTAQHRASAAPPSQEDWHALLDAFKSKVTSEAQRVNAFYNRQWDALMATQDELEHQVRLLIRARSIEVSERKRMLKQMGWFHKLRLRFFHGEGYAPLEDELINFIAALRRNTSQLKKAFLEYYRTLDLLNAYQQLNQAGFKTILKQLYQRTACKDCADLQQELDGMDFTSMEVEDEMTRVEHLLTQAMFKGDRARALQQLRVPEETYAPFDFLTFQAGSFFAVFIFACVIVVHDALASQSLDDYPNHKSMFVMIRGLLWPFLMLALVAINMHVWRMYRINYVLIFSLQHRNQLDYRKVLVYAGYSIGMACIATLVYMYHETLTINSELYSANVPFYLLCAVVAFFVLPYPVMWRQRFWLMRTIGRVITAPWKEVKFEDFWLADQFNSLTLVLLDTHFTICYFAFGQFQDSPSDGYKVCTSPKYIARPILSSLPALWRMLQCIRRYVVTRTPLHLVNAGKYASSLLVVIASTITSVNKSSGGRDTPLGRSYLVVWIITLIINTSYTMYWDFMNDWSVFERKSNGRLGLRKRRLYPYPMYIFAIAQNAILRLAWSISISVGFYDLFFKEGLVAILGFGEMWRRFWWNFFRLENEHLNNCGDFRATKKIPMPFERTVGDVWVVDDYDSDSSGDNPWGEGRDKSAQDTDENSQFLSRGDNASVHPRPARQEDRRRGSTSSEHLTIRRSRSRSARHPSHREHEAGLISGDDVPAEDGTGHHPQ